MYQPANLEKEFCFRAQASRSQCNYASEINFALRGALYGQQFRQFLRFNRGMLIEEIAGRRLMLFQLEERRELFTFFHDERAARRKTAALAIVIGQFRFFCLDLGFAPTPVDIGPWDRVDQQTSVGVLRILDDVIHIARFHHRTPVQDDNGFRDMVGSGEIVRNVEN